MSHILEIGEILWTITMVILTSDGEASDPINFKLVDGNVPCSTNTISCVKKYNDHFDIWVDINQLYERDRCSRDPIYHEFMHIKYWGKDIHNICSFN